MIHTNKLQESYKHLKKAAKHVANAAKVVVRRKVNNVKNFAAEVDREVDGNKLAQALFICSVAGFPFGINIIIGAMAVTVVAVYAEAIYTVASEYTTFTYVTQLFLN